jgi:hypothetical protein
METFIRKKHPTENRFITIFSRIDKVMNEDEELMNEDEELMNAFLKVHFMRRIVMKVQTLNEFDQDFYYY